MLTSIGVTIAVESREEDQIPRRVHDERREEAAFDVRDTEADAEERRLIERELIDAEVRHAKHDRRCEKAIRKAVLPHESVLQEPAIDTLFGEREDDRRE